MLGIFFFKWSRDQKKLEIFWRQGFSEVDHLRSFLRQLRWTVSGDTVSRRNISRQIAVDLAAQRRK
jgi:hypothetical protein